MENLLKPSVPQVEERAANVELMVEPLKEMEYVKIL